MSERELAEIGSVVGLSDEQIAKWRKLADSATPGPWYTTGSPWFTAGSGVLAGSPDPHAGPMIADCETWEGEREEKRENGHPDIGDPDDDAAFIAAARTAVPALIDAIVSAQQQLAEAREALRPFGDSCQNHFHDDSVLNHLDENTSVLYLIREGHLSPTGVSVGDLRRARAIAKNTP